MADFLWKICVSVKEEAGKTERETDTSDRQRKLVRKKSVCDADACCYGDWGSIKGCHGAGILGRGYFYVCVCLNLWVEDDESVYTL